MANKNFPYHVRTTQIGIMETIGGVGNSTMEQFGHHVYQPTSATLAEQTVIIPLTKRTEEIFGGIYSQRLRRHSSQRLQQEAEEALQRPYEEDFNMDNVHNWSQAKNVNSLAVFEPINHGNLGSASSRATSNGTERNARYREDIYGEEYGNGISDYVKEVPIELFTVSKMVVTQKKTTSVE